jgi:integrase
MSGRLPTGLTLRDAAAILETAVRDGSWRAEGLGPEVARFLLYFRSARDASPASVADYESILARFAAENAHRTLADFEGAAGAELVLEFVARRWGDAAPGTRRKVLAVFSSFFRWAARFDRIGANPIDRIDRPRRRRAVRHSHTIGKVRAIIAAQPSLRDQVCIALMACLALRKNEVRLLRWRDVDLERGELRVHGKGGKPATVPIVHEDLRADLARLALETAVTPGEFVLYPIRWGNARSNANLRGVVREHRDRPMAHSTMHRWWKRCLVQAGAADFPMHELRHHAGDEFRRAGNDLELTRVFMRHESTTTTSEFYMHPDEAELRAGMARAGERWNTHVK